MNLDLVVGAIFAALFEASFVALVLVVWTLASRL